MASKSTLVEQDRAYVWHPFTQMQTARPSIPIVKAKGVYLYAEDGRRYLDGISSWWVNLHGHGHPYIVEKIQRQLGVLDHVLFADFTHSAAVDLAMRLLPLLPGTMSKVFYTDNGSTAVEVALKMGLQYWVNQDPKTPKMKVVCFEGSYHGDTFGAMSAAGRNAFNKPFWKCLFDVESITVPIKGGEEESIQQMRALVSRGDVACFIFEPLILGSGGMVVYSSEALNDLLKLCRQHQVIAIADEVMTGFGRTGTLFACDQLDESPDIICLSKGLTGGFLPLGATACSEEIYEAFLGEHLCKALLHGHSYTANPLACTSALASLDLLLNPLCTSQREMIAVSHQAFCEKWRGHHKLKRCEQIGTVLALEYRTEGQGAYFDPMRHHLYSYFLEREILLRPLGPVLYVLPPYCIQKEELHLIYEYIIQTLS